MPAELIRILLCVSRILESLEIPYLTGGSVASSIFGIPRATQDIDLVIDLPVAPTALRSLGLLDVRSSMLAEPSVARSLIRHSSFAI